MAMKPGPRVHEHDYLVVPVTGGIFTITHDDATMSGSVQRAGNPTAARLAPATTLSTAAAHAPYLSRSSLRGSAEATEDLSSPGLIATATWAPPELLVRPALHVQDSSVVASGVNRFWASRSRRVRFHNGQPAQRKIGRLQAPVSRLCSGPIPRVGRADRREGQPTASRPRDLSTSRGANSRGAPEVRLMR